MRPKSQTQTEDELRELVGQRIDDRFETEALIGIGGTAGVFRARDVNTGGLVAVKILHGLAQVNRDLRTRRFAREAEVIAALDHPNALPLKHYGLHAGSTPYLVTELVTGETLDMHLARGALAQLTVIRIMDQVCDVLSAAHAKGIVHRDLKPSNITVEPIDGASGDWVLVRVLDFGLASWRARGRLTMKGAVMGSPRYMAPEQALDRPVSGRTDLYSLGIIAYECLTGQAPFESATPMAEMVRQVSEPPQTIDAVSVMPIDPILSNLIMAMLEKRPADRPPNAEDVRATLAQVEKTLDPDMSGERDTVSMGSVRGGMARIKPRSTAS